MVLLVVLMVLLVLLLLLALKNSLSFKSQHRACWRW